MMSVHVIGHHRKMDTTEVFTDLRSQHAFHDRVAPALTNIADGRIHPQRHQHRMPSLEHRPRNMLDVAPALPPRTLPSATPTPKLKGPLHLKQAYMISP